MTHDLSHAWSCLKIYGSENDYKHILYRAGGGYTCHMISWTKDKKGYTL